MPIYKYRCAGCLHEFENLYKMDDRKMPEGQPCPGCSLIGTVKQGVTAVNITSGGGTNPKPPGDFRDLLKKISKGAGRGSTIET